MSLLQRLKTQYYKSKYKRRFDNSSANPELAHLFDPPTDQEWVAIDCEMTGLNPKKDHLISIAAIHINGNVIDSGNGLHLVCRPPVMPTSETIVIHGLRPLDVEHGLSYEEMLSKILPFISNRKIVGYCPMIDMGFLNPLVKSYLGMPLPNPVIDIRTQYNHYTGNRTGGVLHASQNMTAMLESLNIPTLGAHDAYNDALMTAMIFLHLNQSN